MRSKQPLLPIRRLSSPRKLAGRAGTDVPFDVSGEREGGREMPR
jgi:hypothetical protein